jgi:hydroxyacylglutathione hydrolase
MFFRQYQLGCLSLFSYMVGDTTTGRAVVVDPQRDVSQYLEDATAHGLRIERVIETHVHADFLSGHLELAAATGAVVSYGREARTDFPIEPLAHGQRLVLGEVVLEVRETPGHTPESISIVVWERAGDPQPWGVLTGDTLFVGDVGRPDLLASQGWAPEELARRLYRSLHEQLLSLPDATRVFPAHGAGSACGKHMSSATSSTIGEQRATNYALAPMGVEEFVAVVTQSQSVAPLYFPFASEANRHPHALLDEGQAPPAVSLEEALAFRRQGGVILDTRSPESFASGHLEGSINVGLDGRFAEYAGSVVRPGQPVVLVCEPGREQEARVRLGRIGFDQVAGWLPRIEQLLLERPELARRAPRLPASEAAAWQREEPGLQVVDVRNPSEHQAGLLAGARPLPVSRLAERLGELHPGRPTLVYCSGGYRSSVAASLMRSAGFVSVADLLGGFDAWRAAGLPVSPASA